MILLRVRHLVELKHQNDNRRIHSDMWFIELIVFKNIKVILQS